MRSEGSGAKNSPKVEASEARGNEGAASARWAGFLKTQWGFFLVIK
jgi:hypothetical protein